jgi:2-polyprenyl-3-methyl-5-hydroxy-6-metoxy-1,4-benzoquinol methylase
MSQVARQRHLQLLRQYEMELAVGEFPTQGNVLEIGAGAGWQAKLMHELGYRVSAIDIAGSRYARDRVFPVITFDGSRIPFANSSFDVIFSSNVLEHVFDLDILEREMHRVLRPDGMVIHVVPSASWRFWTLITHHVYVARLVVQEILNFSTRHAEKTPRITGILSRYKPNKGGWRVLLWPEPHGVRGNAITEIFGFSSNQWKNHFLNAGWKVQQCKPIGLFYTGNQILHAYLNQNIRRSLAHIFGGASYIFKLTQSSSKDREK